jgi:hypothetical protein
MQSMQTATATDSQYLQSTLCQLPTYGILAWHPDFYFPMTSFLHGIN